MGVKKWKKEAFVALEVKWCRLPVLSLNPLHCVCHCREYETTRVMQGNPIGEHAIRTCSQKGLWKRFSGHPGYPVACESCWVVSDSLRHHGLYSPCNPPGQNTRAGSHSLLRGSFQPREQTQVSHLAGRSLPSEPPGKPSSACYKVPQINLVPNNAVIYSGLLCENIKKNPLLYLNYSECSQPQIFPKKSQKC